MAAPKGNQFWKLALNAGRPRIFKSPQELLNRAREYFQWCDDNPWLQHTPVKAGDHFGETVTAPIQRPYTLEGLCLYLGIDYQTLENYGSSKGYEEFFETVTNIKQTVYKQQLEGAMVNVFNSSIVARKLALVEQQKTTVEHGVSKNTEEKIDKVIALIESRRKHGPSSTD